MQACWTRIDMIHQSFVAVGVRVKTDVVIGKIP
jgi:hypothetical protein